jgi:PadR family transcriptional regulator PadR
MDVERSGAGRGTDRGGAGRGTDRSGELLQGTLELLVLRALSLEPMHGWGMAQRIEDMSRDVFQVSQGSLYPALQRMKRKGWIRSDWRVTENNRRARYYRLTPAGERQLEQEKESWARASRAVDWVLGWEGRGA